MVEQAAGTGDDDLDPGAQFLDLRVHAHSAVDGGAAPFRMVAEGPDGIMNLLGQLTRRRDDQGADPAGRSFDQTLQDRQNEGGCFARSGLGQAHDVVSLEDRRDGLALDGGWCVIAERPDSGLDLWMEIE